MRCALLLKSALIVLSLAAPLAASAAVGKCERLIATGGADNPPFLWRDPQNPKRLIGANADLLKKITDSLDLKLEVLYAGDAGKASEEVRSGRMDLLVDAGLNVQTLEHLDVVHPAITSLQLVAWVRHEPGFLYASREDLHGRSGAYVATMSTGEAFDHYAKNNLRLRSATGLTESVQQLLGGKLDYVLHERYNAVARLNSQGLLDDVLRLEPPVAERSMHFAIAHDSACNSPWLRGQLAVKMTELRAAGVEEQLLAENLERWKQQSMKTKP
ncbi:MAG: ABC transporter substrate-binding protein [Pseudomonas stutzeri]|nr:ABC transporter substrate-binding protein [Stutzerimonas stutzeri]